MDIMCSAQLCYSYVCWSATSLNSDARYDIPARALQSMYIRVKRQKTTVFLQVEPTDTVLEVKQKLQALLDKVRRCT
jgi:hypothetical protein